METYKPKKTVLGITGYSGSGKTTLIERLIPVLKEKGLKIAVIKHDAHEFEMDREGKDTWRFTQAGADEIMISSARQSALLSKSPRTLKEMTEDAAGADLIFVEGYKKEELTRAALTCAKTGYELPGANGSFAAVITDDVFKYAGMTELPVFDRDDIKGISDWILREFTERDDSMEKKQLTHLDSRGNARMVDVSDKEITLRTARACGRVLVNRDTFALIRDGGIKKGDVLTAARIAGIMGAKRTPELIPMCHPLLIDNVEVSLALNEEECAVEIESRVKCTGRTGVEMEAICACSIAAMTVYDMCKSVQRDIEITQIRLLSKTGGVHGDYER